MYFYFGVDNLTSLLHPIHACTFICWYLHRIYLFICDSKTLAGANWKIFLQTKLARHQGTY